MVLFNYILASICPQVILSLSFCACLFDLYNLQCTESISHQYDILCLQDRQSTSGQFVVDLINSDAKFCGYVVYKTSTEKGRPESQNASFCDTLKGEDNVDQY